MAFDFPNAPTPGSIYSPTGGPAYTWDGQKWVMTGSPVSYTPAYAQRNRIVNGAMQISQENARNAVTTTGGYPADQWQFQFGIITGVQSSSTARSGNIPGFSRLYAGTVYASPAAGASLNLTQNIEGIRIADLMWGTASALPVILRFKARVIVGTVPLVLSASIRNGAINRSYVRNFTITAAVGTFQEFVMAVPGDTTGTWPIDNTLGMAVTFTGMVGSTYITAPSVWTAGNFIGGTGIGNIAAAAGNAVDFADVGLYLDTTGSGIPPAWEMPDEAAELLACSRYFQYPLRIIYTTGSVTNGTGTFTGYTSYKVPMRNSPTLSGTNITQSGFPAAVGALSDCLSGASEYRIPNATQANFNQFHTWLMANARM